MTGPVKPTGPQHTPPPRIPKMLLFAIVVLCLILLASLAILPASALNLRPIYRAF